MRTRVTLGIVVAIILVGFSLLHTQPGKPPMAERVDALIQQLGHEDFAKRQAASKELETIGEPALEPLRKAAATDANVESRKRAEQLIRLIEPKSLTLYSSLISPGLPLAEASGQVFAINIEAKVNAKGSGKGKIKLTTTPPNYDEFGDLVTGREVDQVDRSRKNDRAPIELECEFKYVTTGAVGRVNTSTIQRSLFRVTGPKITSSLMIASEGPGITSGRLLVVGKDGRVDYVVELTDPKRIQRDEVERALPPCHPGCFPAGTPVLVPNGVRRIETLQTGDTAITIGSDGKAKPAVIQKVFVSRNRLVEIRTNRGTLVTTEAQPLCLVDGKFRRSGDLKAGDRIWQWHDGQRVESTVRERAATGRTEQVFNLILGESAVFVAGDFLARGKPPATQTTEDHGLEHGTREKQLP